MLNLEGWAKRAEERATAARQLQKIVEQFPDLLDDLLRLRAAEPTAERDIGGGTSMMEPIPKAPGARAPQRIGKRTAFERIARVFLDNDNDWLNTSELVKRSAVHRNVAATVMWSVHRADFEQRPHATHKRMKDWRLSPEAFDRLRRQSRLFDGKDGA